jgi:hypothetical protein
MPSNPKLFREMSEPFASKEEAREAADAFQEELGELRKKHKIRDVLYVCAFSTIGDNGEEYDSILQGHMGNSLIQEQLAAYALGTIQAERQEMIGQLLSRALKNGRRGD